jgi:rubrerythrin
MKTKTIPVKPVKYDFTCLVCGYEWNRKSKRAPAGFKPKECPECKNRKWNVKK